MATVEEINQHHKERLDAALKEYNVETVWGLPSEVRWNLDEETRKEWVEFTDIHHRELIAQQREQEREERDAAREAEGQKPIVRRGPRLPGTPKQEKGKTYGHNADGTRITANQIRDWAVKEGIVIGKRGRLNSELVEKYKNRNK